MNSSPKMAVLSLLRAAQLSCQSLKTPLGRWSMSLLPKTNICRGPVRQMSHGRKMEILPSRFDYTRWKDSFHFYLALGLIPIGATIFLSNLFIGNAELIDIPEGYHPEHWEYYKHPITRTFSKYLIDKPEKSYEVHLHAIHQEQQKAKMRALEKKVKRLMAERGDYKGWYYVPYGNERHIYVSREKSDEEMASKGFGG